MDNINRTIAQILFLRVNRFREKIFCFFFILEIWLGRVGGLNVGAEVNVEYSRVR